MASLPDIVIEECVPGLDTSVWRRVVHKVYAYHVMKNSPIDQGVPMLRPRMLGLNTLRRRLDIVHTLDSGMFENLFTRSVETHGDVFLQASEAERQAEMSRVVGRRKHIANGTVSLENLVECLAPGTACRLEGYQMLGQQGRKLTLPCLIANAGQDFSERESLNCFVPTLLRESVLVCIRSKLHGIQDGSKSVLYLGNEHMAAMGWPVYQNNVVNVLRDVLPGLSDPCKRSVAGNGLCVSQLGYMIYFALGSTKRVRDGH